MATFVDISSSRRIELLSRLMEDMAGLVQPDEAMDLFSRGMRQAYEGLSAIQLSTVSLQAGEFRVTRMAVGIACGYCELGESSGKCGCATRHYEVGPSRNGETTPMSDARHSPRVTSSNRFLTSRFQASPRLARPVTFLPHPIPCPTS